MRKILMMLAAILLISMAANADDVKCNPAEIQGIAVFKTDGVNLRMGPSASAPYLCTQTFDDEMYFNPASVTWSHMTGTANVGKVNKYQAFSGMTMPVVGKEGDWVKMYLSNSGNPFEVWTMSKFVDIQPMGDISSRSVTNPEYGNNCFTCLVALNPTCAYLQEPGMDEDGGIYIGKLDASGKMVQFNVFVPINPVYKENVRDIKITVDPDFGSLMLEYGPKYLNEEGNEYSGLNIRAVPGKTLSEISKRQEATPTSAIAVAGADGYVILIP